MRLEAKQSCRCPGIHPEGWAFKATGNGGTSVHFAPVIHIDSRTDRAEVTALVSRAMKVTKAELVDDLSRKRLLRAS